MNAMTRLFALIAFVPFLSLGCNSAVTVTVDESEEPSLRYSVMVGEKTVTISEGQTVQVDGTFSNPKLMITPQAHRVFSYQGLTFEYPRAFTFEADLDDRNAKNWTLSGNDLKIMYFVLNANLSTADFSSNMIDQFGGKNAKVADANATITLGKHILTGTSLHATVVGHQMVMDIYRIPSRVGVTKLLVFQDSLDSLGHRSKEGEQTIVGIKSSLTIEE